ncbi:MAG: Gfo/Idh/MocA family oxidoreductase [Candidatus Hydrogenedentes bacterium]|nr:Gfo/Idh/MocA family oxidoreductase [Candidatus Hydrogenedentota bacterium]
MNVGIIGCGTMGKLHAKCAQNLGLKVSKCFDEIGKAGKSFAKEVGAKVSSSWEDLIDDPKVDLVVIATPTPYHYPALDRAIAKGKHVFCEKPLCRTTEECAKIVRKAENSSAKVFVGHVVRYFHEFEAIREQITLGKIGEVGFIKMYRGGASPSGVKKWFQDFEKSGGVTLDCMIHDFDWLRYVFGEVDYVFCQNLTKLNRPPLDYSQVTIRMKNGVLGLVIGTWAHAVGFRVKVEVCGSGGLIYYDNMEGPIDIQLRKKEASQGTIIPESPVRKSPYEREWEDFLGWIEKDEQPRVNLYDGLKAVEIASACIKSSVLKQVIKL